MTRERQEVEYETDFPLTSHNQKISFKRKEVTKELMKELLKELMKELKKV